MGKRGDCPRALRQVAKEEAENIVVTNIALRVGQAIWYVGTYPLRLLLRGVDAL